MGQINMRVARSSEVAVVGHDQYGHPAVGLLSEHRKDVLSKRRIQCARHLIDKQHRAVQMQCAQQGQTLLLSAAEVASSFAQHKAQWVGP